MSYTQNKSAPYMENRHSITVVLIFFDFSFLSDGRNILNIKKFWFWVILFSIFSEEKKPFHRILRKNGGMRFLRNIASNHFSKDTFNVWFLRNQCLYLTFLCSILAVYGFRIRFQSCLRPPFDIEVLKF